MSNISRTHARLGEEAHTDARRPRLIDQKKLREILPVSKSTLAEHVAKGRIPGVIRIGRRVLIDQNAVEDWIAAGAPPLDGSST